MLYCIVVDNIQGVSNRLVTSPKSRTFLQCPTRRAHSWDSWGSRTSFPLHNNQWLCPTLDGQFIYEGTIPKFMLHTTSQAFKPNRKDVDVPLRVSLFWKHGFLICRSSGDSPPWNNSTKAVFKSREAFWACHDAPHLYREILKSWSRSHILGVWPEVYSWMEIRGVFLHVIIIAESS